MISRPGHGEPVDINDDPSLGSSLEPWTIYKINCMEWENQPPETRGEKPSLEQEMQRYRDSRQKTELTMQLLGSLSNDQSDK